MKTVNEQTVYEDLANAIVGKACEDYLEGRKHLWSLDYGPKRSRAYKDKAKLIVKWTGVKDSAESFLRSERLAIFTKVSGEYLISKLDEEFDEWKSTHK